MQVLIDDLQDKIQAQESKIKNQQNDLEKTKREGQINLDQIRIMERNIDDLKSENDQLRDKLTVMD